MAKDPKYEVLRDSWLDQPDEHDKSGYSPRMVRKGQKITYRGWPGASLGPIDDEARRRAAIVEEYRKSGRKMPATVAEHDEQVRAAKAAVKSAAKPLKADQVAA